MRFRYKAMDSNGREINGGTEAKSESDALNTIKEKGLFPIHITKCLNEDAPVENEDYNKGKSNKNLWGFAIIVYLIGIGTGIIIVQYFK